MIKKIIILSALAMFGLTAMAQGGSLPFLRLNADARTGAMGDAFMGESSGMYIYTNPTSFLQDASLRTYGSYTYGMLPKVDDTRNMYHALSAGYRIDAKQAVLIGFRYMGGTEVEIVGASGISRGKIRPNDYSVDLSYTRDFGKGFSAFLTGTLIQTYIGRRGYTGSASGGVYWRHSTNMSDNPLDYTIGLGVYDFGGFVKYGKKKYSQPTSIGLGGSFSLGLAEMHKLNLGWTARYFPLLHKEYSYTGAIGLEYEFKNMLAARTGYHYEAYNSYATVGLGYKMKNFHVDVAYKVFTEESIDNSLFLGFSVMF